MENPNHDKVAVVNEVKGRISSADAVLLTEYRGLTVKELAELRAAIRPAGGEYTVYKNTLVRFAARELDLELDEQLTGPTAIAFVKGDAAAVAKALRDFARANPNLIVKGGVLDGKALSAKDASALAELPSREVLLAQFAGLMAAPMVQFASLLQALPRNLAYGLQALADKGGAGNAPAAPAAEASAPASEADASADAPEAEASAEAPATEATEES